MTCKIEKSQLNGEIVCPSSKSYTHRAVFLAALSDGKSIVKEALYSSDTRATIDACKTFGVDVHESGDIISIDNSINLEGEGGIIDVVNSGTTIRIATAIAAISPNKTILSGDSSIKKRPMKPLLDSLESLGAKCISDDGKPPITVSGTIKGGEVKIIGDVSSQFISALLIIAPRLQNGLELNVEGNIVSKPYIDSTIASMEKFGVEVETIEKYKKYKIEHQTYKPTEFSVPSDFSNLALLLSATVLIGNDVSIKISMGDLPQGDELFIDILEKMGVIVTLQNNIISLKTPAKLDGGKFDLSNTPDLLPPLAILVLKSQNPIWIYNVAHARFKETDRIKIIVREIKKIGVRVEEKDDGMILYPPENITSAQLDSENDHRLFMAFCICGMYVGGCEVTNPESVEVSYPNFISDIAKIGGNIFQT